jgi:glycosyltransferase involved in cell wall biosynthesis
MIVHFFEPPPAQATGGLNLAMRSLEQFLERAGVSVRSNPPLEELGKGSGPEVVHFHGLWQPRFVMVSAHCRRARIPYVVSPHGMLEPWAWRHKRWKKWPWFYLAERRHLAGAARLLTTSDAEARHLQRMFPSARCVALPLGLPAVREPDHAAARRMLGWGASEVVLLFLSRIHPKKGLHLLLPALAQLGMDVLQNVRLVIVGGGDGRYLGELKTFVQHEQARLPRVDWIGEIWGDARWAYFQGADLFCLPSFSENFGLAVLEALQVGTRVLTTDQTPWSDLPSLGAGFVVEPAQAGLEAALSEFLARPEWPVERRAKLAAEIHRRFSWDTVGPPYLRLYEDVLRHA